MRFDLPDSVPRESGVARDRGVLPSGSSMFPLPVNEIGVVKKHSARRQAQRHQRRFKSEFELCETVQALNWLHGFDFTSQSCKGSMNPLQSQVVERIRGLVERAGDLGGLQHPFTPEAALKSLLQGRSDYHEPATPIALAPFNLELISLPASLKEAPHAEDLLPENDRLYLKEQERMFRPDHVSHEFFKPYWDPALKHSPHKYRSFIQKLHSIDYLRYTLHPVEMAGIFFVKKSDGRRIRMIVDGRGANLRLKDPPSVPLSTAETFSRIEMTVPEDLVHDPDGRKQFFSDIHVYAALSDVKDCFHRIRQPDWMCKLFCLLPIEARHVGLTGHTLEGVTLLSNDLVYPMPGSLAMGCSWSLYFAQKINEHQFSISPSLGDSGLIHDRGPPLVIDPQDPHKLNHYVYVDNLGIIGQSRELVTEGLNSVENHFNSSQLLLHPGEVHSESVKALGIQLDGSRKTTRISPDRLHKVRSGIRGLISRGRCSGRVLEIVIGHATFCGLACRLVLSVFHSSYKFIEKNYEHVAPLWSSVRDELRAFAGLMVFLESDWTRGWNTLVTASDASEKGFGVCTSHWTSMQVAAAGRVPEKSRFRRTESHRARESALTAAGFHQESSTGKWLAGEIDSQEYLDDIGWECSPSFKEIDAQLLHKELWTPKLWGTWNHEEHILVLEARALNKALNRIAVTKFGQDIRQLLLVDSMSVALSFDRCRSRSFKLLRQIRKYAAVCLARNIDPHVRWIPSEFNSADEPSRADGAEPSKTLVDQIPRRYASSAEKENFGNPGDQFKPGGQEASWSASRPTCRESVNSKTDTDFAEEFSSEAVGDPASRVASNGFDQSELGDKEFKTSCSSPTVIGKFELFNGASGQEEGKDPRGSKQTSGEEVCGRRHGSGKPGALLAGEEGHWEGCRTLLHHRIQPVPVLCLQECLEFAEPIIGGCSHDQVHEPSVLAGSPISSWGQADGGLHAPAPGVQPVWIQPSSSLISSVERLEKVSPRFVTQSLPSGCLVSHSRRDGSYESCSDGGVHNDLSFSIHQAQRALPVQDHVVDSTNTTGHRPLVPFAESRRVCGSLKDGGVRRQHSVRLSLFETLGFSALSGAEETACTTAPVGLRLSELLPGLCHCGQEDANRDHALQHETFGPVHRPKSKHQTTTGSAKERTLEKSQECHSIREVGSLSSQFQPVASQDSASLPSRRITSRGCDAGPYQAPSATLKRGNRPGKYVADLFAGEGGVAHQCRRLGYKAKEWELDRGLQFDLTNRKVLRKLIGDVKKGRVLAAMLAPPCTTFSIARDRTKVIRSREYPWGLPADQLTPAELEKVVEGNKCFEAAFELIYHFNKHRVPWLLENPATSKCWHLPPIHDLLDNHGCLCVTLDFCVFGAPWKKATTFLAGQLDAQDLGRLQHRCQGRGGFCSRTQKKHWQLTGAYRGKNLTKLAQPYPTKLCRQIAYVLTAPSHYN